MSIITKQDALVSETFDFTRRNICNPFFSSPLNMKQFNNQRLTKIKNKSRFPQVEVTRSITNPSEDGSLNSPDRSFFDPMTIREEDNEEKDNAV